jgi:hypothetical protein
MFRRQCLLSKHEYSLNLPNILKYKPKQFWGMFKKQDPTTNTIDKTAFASFNQQLFHDPTIPPDTFTPLEDPTSHLITPEELIHVTKHHFRANKSSGLSPLPLQLLKHFGPTAAAPLATFLNASAITTEPPQTWRNTKIVPLFK